MKREFPGGATVELITGDITKVRADAIVNAANAALAGGGGVDGAIHRAGGPPIRRELDTIRAGQGGCPTGSAVVTSAGNLPARFVFHAVGPVYRGGSHNEAALLAACYTTCLRLADRHEVRRITFPSISTGAYGYPVAEAAEVAIRAVWGYFSATDRPQVREVVFVLFDRWTHEQYAKALDEFAPPGEETR